MAFVIVANLDDLDEGETLFVEGLKEPICLVRLDGEDVRAVHNTCTHQQQPLHEGTVQDDDTLVCASHNSRFNLDNGRVGRHSRGAHAAGVRLQGRRGRDPGRHRPAAQRRPYPAPPVPLTAGAAGSLPPGAATIIVTSLAVMFGSRPSVWPLSRRTTSAMRRPSRAPG